MQLVSEHMSEVVALTEEVASDVGVAVVMVITDLVMDLVVVVLTLLVEDALQVVEVVEQQVCSSHLGVLTCLRAISCW